MVEQKLVAERTKCVEAERALLKLSDRVQQARKAVEHKMHRMVTRWFIQSQSLQGIDQQYADESPENILHALFSVKALSSETHESLQDSIIQARKAIRLLLQSTVAIRDAARKLECFDRIERVPKSW